MFRILTSSRSAGQGAAALSFALLAAGGICTATTATPAEKHGTQTAASVFDVVVVGAGVFGLSTAWHLAKLGHKVAVLEREHVGALTVASSVNAGFLENSFSSFGSRDGDNARSLLDERRGLEEMLYGGSLAIYANLAENHPNIEFQRMGLLELLESPEQVELHVDEWEMPLTAEFLKNGEPLPPSGSAILDLVLLRQIEPMVAPRKGMGTRTLGAVLYPNCATTHPAKTMKAMKSEAIKDGVTVIEGVHVDSLRRIHHGAANNNSSRWIVSGRTLKDRLSDPNDGDPIDLFAHDVVVACGGLTDAVLRTALNTCQVDDDKEGRRAKAYEDGERGGAVVPVVPVLGQMFRTMPEPGRVRRLRHLISSGESTTYWATHEPTHPPDVTHERTYTQGNETGIFGPRLTRHLYGKQTREGEYLFGGDRRVHPPLDLDGFHPVPHIVEDMHESCYKHAIEAVPAVGSLPVAFKWGGIMSFSPDGVPIAGRVVVPGTPEHYSDGLWVATGLGGCGFMRGAMAGLLLAEVVGKGPRALEAEKVLATADPTRFHLRQEEPSVVETAR